MTMVTGLEHQMSANAFSQVLNRRKTIIAFRGVSKHAPLAYKFKNSEQLVVIKRKENRL